MTRDSRFTGYWDQSRLWMATDHATLADISKVLFHGPSARVYLNEFHNAVNAGAVSIEQSYSPAMMEDKLLLAAAPDAEALDWLVREKMVRTKGKSISFLRANRAAFSDMFGDGPDEQDVANGIAALASSLTRWGGSEGLSLAVSLLLDKSLESRRALFAAAPEMSWFALELAQCSDDSAANSIMDVLAAIKPHGWQLGPLNISNSLSQATKDRAARMLAGN
jgi:hypothetical protein